MGEWSFGTHLAECSGDWKRDDWGVRGVRGLRGRKRDDSAAFWAARFRLEAPGTIPKQVRGRLPGSQQRGKKAQRGPTLDGAPVTGEEGSLRPSEFISSSLHPKPTRAKEASSSHLQSPSSPLAGHPTSQNLHQFRLRLRLRLRLPVNLSSNYSGRLHIDVRLASLLTPWSHQTVSFTADLQSRSTHSKALFGLSKSFPRPLSGSPSTHSRCPLKWKLSLIRPPPSAVTLSKSSRFDFIHNGTPEECTPFSHQRCRSIQRRSVVLEEAPPWKVAITCGECTASFLQLETSQWEMMVGNRSGRA